MNKTQLIIGVNFLIRKVELLVIFFCQKQLNTKKRL